MLRTVVQNSDFEPQHKPAQEVLTKYYGGGCPKAP
jgi:hypothetical protein|eukprot:COSAG06_NODE_10213_length_1725_cov_3.816113_1_plen_35_part_00